MKPITHKDFLKVSSAGGGAALLARSRTAAAVASSGSPNGDVGVAIVGVNGRDGDHIGEFACIPGVKVVALCDVDSAILAKRAGDFEPKGYKVKRYAAHAATADPILHHGKVVTVDRRFSSAEAITVANGMILAVGSNAETLALEGSRATKVDLGGKMLLPGFAGRCAYSR